MVSIPLFPLSFAFQKLKTELFFFYYRMISRLSDRIFWILRTRTSNEFWTTS